MSSWPDLEVLALFVAVVEEGSLGAGAARVAMAQPNASRAIRRLESEVGEVLLTRTPRGSHPTVYGRLLAEWAVPLLASAKAFSDNLQTLPDHRMSHIDVAASMTVAEHLMPRWLATLRRTHPESPVRLHIDNSARVIQRVLLGEVEVGFIENHEPGAGLQWRTVAQDELLLVVPPDHPWAAGVITIDQLVATSLVLREPGSGTRAVLERAVGIPLASPAAVLNSNAAVRASVRAGVGPAVLSKLAVRDDVSAGALAAVAILGLDLRRPLRAIWRQGQRPRGAAAQLLIVADEDRHR